MRRKNLLLVAVALCIGIVFATPAGATNVGGTGGGLVIQKDRVLAGWNVQRDPTLAGAISRLGSPSRVAPHPRFSSVCNVRWRKLGLRVRFANLGLGSACEPSLGRIDIAYATGKKWRTLRGLKIGDKPRRISRLYPEARVGRTFGSTKQWLLYSRPSDGVLIGVGVPGPRQRANLMAHARRGAVRQFVVVVGAQGE